MDRAKMKQFPEFHLLVKDLHCLPNEINFTISYTDPRNGDLLPINNDDNLLRAYTTAMPFLKLFVYREQGNKSNIFCEHFGIIISNMSGGLVY